MNLSEGQAVSPGVGISGAGGTLGGAANAGPAHPYVLGQIGFSQAVEDSMTLSIVRLERENEELRAEVALLREERRILQNTIEGLRDQLCADKCRDKAAADGGWANV